MPIREWSWTHEWSRPLKVVICPPQKLLPPIQTPDVHIAQCSHLAADGCQLNDSCVKRETMLSATIPRFVGSGFVPGNFAGVCQGVIGGASGDLGGISRGRTTLGFQALARRLSGVPPSGRQAAPIGHLGKTGSHQKLIYSFW